MHGSHPSDGHDLAPGNFGPETYRAAFAIGITLNVAFVLIEAGFGIFSNSVALIADAGHNLSDVLGLVIAWFGVALSRRPPSKRYTYGLRRSSLLAALANAVILLVAVGAIAWEAVLRLFEPQPVAGTAVIAVAAVGIVVNGITAWLFASGRGHDINIKGAFLHMAADAAVSAAVVVAGLLILVTGQLWLDPLASLLIVIVIIWGTWGLLRDSVSMLMDAVPPGIDPDAVRAFIEARPGVLAVHDLHIWPMSTTDTGLTAHMVMPGGHPGDGFLHTLADQLRDRWRIGHVTLQVETDGATCPLAPDNVV